MTYNDIVSDINFLCGTTSASYPPADKVRSINVAYNNVARLIWNSADGWQYDDTNQTDLPIATTDLVHNQQDYSLPSTSQRIQRIEVMDSNGDYQVLKQKDIHDIDLATSEYLETAGMPMYYDIFASSIYLYPKPTSADGGVTLTSGLKVYFDRDVSAFVTGSTTREPGFASPFHRLLSLGAAIDFERDPAQRRTFVEAKERLERGLVEFYAHRNIQRRTSIRPRGRRRWRQYL